MESRAPNSSSVGLQRVPLKDLAPDLDNILIVAIIIGKQAFRKFPSKNQENDQYTAVWGFTLRDSARDYINVMFWGPSEEVSPAYLKFYTGDVVEIRNPRIGIRKFNETSEQYCPIVTSPYSLSLNKQQQMLPHHGDTFNFVELLSFPTKPLSGFVPIRDIQKEGGNMTDRPIDILGAVRSVGPVRNIKGRNGQDIELRDVVLFDHTSLGLKATLWDKDVILRANKWKPRSTILFLTDAKIMYSTFWKSYTASIGARCIVTVNPIGREAITLSAYAKTAPLDTAEILEQLIADIPDPDSIQNVMCVQQVKNRIEAFQQANGATEPHFTALIFAFVTHLDLDGAFPVVTIKCSSCKSWLKSESTPCENSDCVERSLDYSFDIKIHLSDHTGTLINCRLSGSAAERVLGCSVNDFQRMSNEQKAKLKWKYLMERCAVRIVGFLSNRFAPRISIVSCSRAEPLEAVQRIPLC